MLKNLSLVLLITVIPATLFSEPTLTGTKAELTRFLSTEQQTVQLVGEYTHKVAADAAVITLLINTKSNSLATSLKENQKVRNLIVSTLVGKGIPNDKITSSKFTSLLNEKIFRDDHEIENKIQVEISTETDFLEISYLIDKFKEVSFESAEFKVKASEPEKDIAFNKAVEDLKHKKKLYESAFGITLDLVTFHPGNVYEEPEVYRNNERHLKMAALAADVAPPVAPIGFDQKKFKAIVRAEYSVQK